MSIEGGGLQGRMLEEGSAYGEVAFVRECMAWLDWKDGVKDGRMGAVRNCVSSVFGVMMRGKIAGGMENGRMDMEARLARLSRTSDGA